MMSNGMSGMKAFYFFETSRFKIVFTDSETVKRFNEVAPFTEAGKVLVFDDLVPEIIFLDKQTVKALRLTPFNYRLVDVYEVVRPILISSSPGRGPRSPAPP